MKKIMVLLLAAFLLVHCKKDPLAEVRALAFSKDVQEKEQAAEYYQQAIETLVQAYSSLGLLNKEVGQKLMSNKQFKPAIMHLEKAKEIRNTDAWVYYWIGVCHANIYKNEKNQDSLIEAEKNYKIALNINPDGKEFVYAFAQLLIFGLQEYDKAIEILRKYLYELKADDYNGYLLLGRSYYALGDFSNAYQVFNETLKFKRKMRKSELDKLYEFIEQSGRKLGN